MWGRAEQCHRRGNSGGGPPPPLFLGGPLAASGTEVYVIYEKANRCYLSQLKVDRKLATAVHFVKVSFEYQAVSTGETDCSVVRNRTGVEVHDKNNTTSLKEHFKKQ